MLRKQNPITQHSVTTEFHVASKHGFIFDIELIQNNNWFDLPRSTRATYVAQYKLENLTNAINQHDAMNERKRK